MITFPYLLTESDVDEIFEAAGAEIWDSMERFGSPAWVYRGVWITGRKPTTLEFMRVQGAWL